MKLTVGKILPFALALPFLTLAQGAADLSFLEDLIGGIGGILRTLVPILVTLALVVFIWGLIRYIASGGDEEKRKEARQTMIWGVIIFAVIVSIWGLVALLRSIFGVTDVNPIEVKIPGIAN